MKILKSLLVCLLVCFSIQTLTAQVYRFKATSYSIAEKDANGKWGEWSEFKKSTVVITLDGTKDRVIVGSKELQLFTIDSYGKNITTEDDDTVPLNCTDNGGGACTILIITRKKQNNRKQFYINYADVKFVYNVYSWD